MSLLLSQAYTHLASLWRASLPGHGERFRVNRQVHLRLEPLEQRQLFSVSPLPLSTLGSNDGVAQVARISRQITTGDGQVSYTADLAIGQKLAFAATVAGSALDVELINPLGQVIVDATATANAPRLQTPLTISTAGSWTIRFASAGTSTLSLDVAVNAGIEYYDITWAQPQSLASGYTLADTVGRFAWVGNTSTADSDDYTVDLTSRVGKSIDITIRGEGSTNLSAQRLELIGPDGEVLATGTPYAMQGAPNNLRIANFVVPTAGVYSIRYVSNVASRYELSVSDTVPLEQFSASNILNLIVTQGWTTKSTVDELLSTLDFDNVFWSMSTDQLLTKLLNLGVVNGYSDLTTLKAALPGHNIDLTILRPDGVLTALATTPTGSLFRSNGTSIDAPQVKNLLKQNYLSDQRAFLNIFDVRSLIGLFDNSITPQAGTMTDPLYVIVDKPIAPTTAKITQSYRLWVKDAGGPEVVSPAEALAATINMPVGYRAFFLTNFLEIPGFDGGLTEAAGYVDTKLSNGNTAQYSLLWMDDWEAVATAKLSTFLSQYKQLGGQLEYLVIDIEDTSLSYHSTRGTDRRVDKSATPTINIWQELLSDPRWPALKAELVARGIPEADLSLANIGTWDVHSANAARWNAVMSERLAGYLNRAIADTVFTYFPDALVSNYGNKYHTQTIPARRYSQLNNSYYSLGPIVGNSQSQSMYGAYTDVTTPGTISGPNLQFDARIKNISFIQNTNSSGAKLPSGTAVVTFFEPINGIQVGDEIIVENRGVDWIDKKYTGEFKVSWISSDRKTIRYTLQLPDTKAPKTYDLSTRSQVELTAFVDFNRSYERFVGEVKALRSQVAASSATLLPWASNPDYREFINNFEWNHFSEVFFHAALSGADAILWWKAGFETQPENTAEMAKLVTEVNALIGYTGRETLSFDNPHWDDGYVLTGMEANGKRVYRFTPDPHLSMTILSNSGTVRIKIGDKTVEIPNASIYTPSSPASSLGLWIVQTKGSTSLNGAASQVLQALSASLAPSVTAPSAVMTGSPTDFVFRTDPSLVPAGTLIAYDVDWNGDGKTDRTYYGTNQVTATATWSSAGSWTVRVQASIVGTGEKLPLVEHSIRALTSGFSVETSTSDSPVKNLIYAGTSAGDTVYFKSAGNGVIDAIVINGSTTTTRTFTGINGAIYAYGLGGNDILVAADANVPAFLFGGEGNDLLIASTRSSQLFGENGDDTLVGMSGSTLFDGGAGKNTIQLGAGVSMVAEGGNDKILGGTNYISVPRESLNIFAQSLASVANRAAAAALPVATDVAQAASLPSARSSSVNKSVDSVFDEFDPFDDEDPFA